MTSDVLLIGAGDLGADIGLRLARLGHAVVAVRRRGDLVPAPMRGVSADLTHERPTLPPMTEPLLVVCLTARPRTEEAYRATYVDGMERALDALADAGHRPRRAVLVSSTGVFGDADPETLVDESTPPAPGDAPAAVLLEAEHVFRDRVPSGSVVRFSGLYRDRSPRLERMIRDGEVTDPHRWTNRIHRDDAAEAVVHLLTRATDPEALYIGTDDEPAQLGTVTAHLAALHGLPTPPPADPSQGHGKRLSNARLRASGWTPRHPTFRDGYTAPRSTP